MTATMISLVLQIFIVAFLVLALICNVATFRSQIRMHKSQMEFNRFTNERLQRLERSLGIAGADADAKPGRKI